MSEQYRGYRRAGRVGPRYSDRGRSRGFYNGSLFRTEEPGTFSIHPRSRFERTQVSSKDLHVEEIGFYSLEGDVEDLTVRFDRSAMRRMTTKCDPDGPASVKLDLEKPFEWEGPERQYVHVNEFLPLFDWIKMENASGEQQDQRENFHIVTSKSVLSELAKVPYNQDSFGAVGWLVGAARVDGKVVIGHVTRPETHKLLLRGDSYTSDQERESSFRGRRFEAFMTQTAGNPNVSPLGFSRFRSVLKVQLRDLRLMVESGIDAVDPSCQETFPGNYVEFTILPAGMLRQDPVQESRLYRQRLLRWWVNNVFIGLGSVHVGVHEEGIVNEVHTYRLEDIPKLVKEKEQELEQNLWSDSICLGFVHEFLRYILRIVRDDHKQSVYEFKCFKENGIFTHTVVPACDAVGHDYIPKN